MLVQLLLIFLFRMNWCTAISVVFLTLTICLTRVTGEITEHCKPRNESYHISDSEQCDKYYVCEKSGKTTEKLCDDGFVFAETIRGCDYPHNVDCSKRPKLQPAQSIGDPQCARLNGFYPFPPRDSCSKFYHCLEGKAYEKSCPEGVIFDPSKGACVHPDMSTRVDCAAHTVLNFKCPNMNQRFSRLRFGDHDRFSHPTDCRKFFICLADGQPRIGGCPFGKVFHQKTGFCDEPKKVPECKDYYSKFMKDGKLDNPEEQNPEDNDTPTTKNTRAETSKDAKAQAQTNKDAKASTTKDTKDAKAPNNADSKEGSQAAQKQ